MHLNSETSSVSMTGLEAQEIFVIVKERGYIDLGALVARNVHASIEECKEETGEPFANE